MPRFFVDLCTPLAPGDILHLEGEDARHVALSLRCRLGEELVVCDGANTQYQCRIQALDPRQVGLQVVSAQPCESEPPVRLHVYQAFLKGDKLEEVVQKCVELGVSDLTPVFSDNVVSRPDRSSWEKKLVRWQKIAREAAMQCGRGIVPRVHPPVDLAICLQGLARTELGFVCYENEKDLSLKALLPAAAPASCAFFIGPEGGLSPKEVQAVDGAELPRVSLGHRILRAHTAAPAVLAMLSLAWEL